MNLRRRAQSSQADYHNNLLSKRPLLSESNDRNDLSNDQSDAEGSQCHEPNESVSNNVSSQYSPNLSVEGNLLNQIVMEQSNESIENRLRNNQDFSLSKIQNYFRTFALPPCWARSLNFDPSVIFSKLDLNFRVKFLLQITNQLSVNVRHICFYVYFKNYFII